MFPMTVIKFMIFFFLSSSAFFSFHLIFYPIFHPQTLLLNCRSSHQRCSVRKGVLRNFTKLTGKHLRPATLLKKVTFFFFCSWISFSRCNFLVAIVLWSLFYLFITFSFRYDAKLIKFFRTRSSSGENQKNTIYFALQLSFWNLNLSVR